jgi:hypothetical protein
MLAYISSACVEFGHLPMYGNTDPTAFGYAILWWLAMFSFILSHFVYFIWISQVIFRIFFKERFNLFGKAIEISMATSIVAFFILNVYFSSTIEWFFD